jgi:hypothetical protein
MNKITKNIEALMARHNNAQDCAKTLRRQMATTGRPVVTYNQLVIEQSIACGKRDLEYAKNLSLIFSAMLDQEMQDSGHSRKVCQEYLRLNIALGRIKVAKMQEVYRSYTDGSCATAGKPFARISIMGQVRDVLEHLQFSAKDVEVAEAAKADAIEMDMKLGEFTDLVRKCQNETGTDSEILAAMDPDYVAVI